MIPCHPGLGRRADDGQAAVELALGLPVVAVAVLAVVQVVLVGRDQVAVIHAAREAARAAAVAADPVGEGTAAARAAIALPGHRVHVEIRTAGDLVTAVVSYRSPTDLPLVGAAVDDVTVTGRATMRWEP